MSELENKIESFIKDFNKKNIEIIFGNFLKGKIGFNNVNIEYNENNGFLSLISNDNNLEFNTLDINYIEYKDNILEVNLDNSLKINIKIK